MYNHRYSASTRILSRLVRDNRYYILATTTQSTMPRSQSPTSHCSSCFRMRTSLSCRSSWGPSHRVHVLTRRSITTAVRTPPNSWMRGLQTTSSDVRPCEVQEGIPLGQCASKELHLMNLLQSPVGCCVDQIVTQSGSLNTPAAPINKTRSRGGASASRVCHPVDRGMRQTCGAPPYPLVRCCKAKGVAAASPAQTRTTKRTTRLPVAEWGESSY
jgi:hypothetical protein